MHQQKHVILKPGREKAVKNKHHWIFSGAVATLPSFENGELLQVTSHTGQKLGWGYFNKHSGIVGRMLIFGDEDPKKGLISLIDASLALRKSLFDEKNTNAYRLINGEGDFLPGLIVDKYDEHLCIQIGTCGMERLKKDVVEHLATRLKPEGIYEKSNGASRPEEGLAPFEGIVFGSVPEELTIKENGALFSISIQEGQKTGFFLDQREMRAQIKNFSKGKKILNCFSYSGGFSVFGLLGGAILADSVDISEKALALAKKNMIQNGFHDDRCRFFAVDTFQFLREHALDYDIVILDPPAFAKKQKDVINACRAYKDINRVAMQKMPAGSMLLTCSCSYHIEESLFQKVVFQAALEAKRSVRILGSHVLSHDHPINLFHPESSYLKGLFLYIE